MLPTDHRLLLTVILVAAVGCGRPPRAAMLHELPSFSGTVRVTGDGESQPFECDVSLSRRERKAQSSFSIEGRQVTLLRDENDAITTFENAEERASTSAEKKRFALILDLFDPSRVQTVEPGEKTYHLRRGGVRYAIEVSFPQGHGTGNATGEGPR